MIFTNNSRIGIFGWFTALLFVLLVTAGISACQKDGNASPTGLNTQINILNLSPDVRPLFFYINNQRGTKNYRYPNASGYIFLNALDNQLQMRRHPENLSIFDSVPVLRANTRYSLFIFGLQNNNAWRHVFVADTDALPAVGRGKVRFINAVSRAATLDVTANGTPAFKAQQMGVVSKYIEMPAGIYQFKFLPTGTTGVVTEVPSVTIQDGRLYTLYTYGIVGRTDSAQVGANVIINR